jgi:hypothetical protein
MYFCVEDIGFTSKPIFSKHKYIERAKTDILNTQIHRKKSNRYPQHTNTQKEVKPISSTHKYKKRGKTDILNTQIHRKR